MALGGGVAAYNNNFKLLLLQLTQNGIVDDGVAATLTTQNGMVDGGVAATLTTYSKWHGGWWCSCLQYILPKK